MKFNYIFLAIIIFFCSTTHPMNQNKKKSFLDKIKEETEQWKKRTKNQNEATGIADTFELEKIKKIIEK